MKQHPLDGKWFSPEWSSVEITIKTLKTTIQVKAIDTYDNEKLIIRNKTWDDDSITFDLFTPSENNTCHHVFKYKGNSEASCTITFTEDWKLKET